MSEVPSRVPDAPSTRSERERPVAGESLRPAYWSRAGLLEGARATLTLVPGQFMFGMAFGAVAAQKGFTLVEALTMTGIVYAGMSQFVAVQSWPDVLTPSTVAAIMLLTGAINVRFFLIGASLRPWLGTLPGWQAYPLLSISNDGGWLLSMRYRMRGGSDASFFLGGHVLSYTAWTLAALPGFLLAERIPNPKTFGIDLLMPAFFAAMLVPQYRSIERTIPWVIAGIVAVAVDWLTPGYWFIIAGAIAGSVSAAIIVREEAKGGR